MIKYILVDKQEGVSGVYNSKEEIIDAYGDEDGSTSWDDILSYSDLEIIKVNGEIEYLN